MYNNDINSIIKAQNGDKKAMEDLIKNNNGLIWSIVKRFSNRGYETEDLYQIGCLGFIKSIKRFDTSFEVRLSTYSVPYILGEIRRFLRDDGPIKISRSIKELQVKILEIKKQRESNNKKELTIDELAKELKVDKEDIILAVESINSVESIDKNYGTENKDGKTLTLYDKISSGKNEQEIITNHITLKQLINELKDRDKELILLRFFKDKTQAEVAKILGVSQVQVSRMERKILHSMRLKISG